VTRASNREERLSAAVMRFISNSR